MQPYALWSHGDTIKALVQWGAPTPAGTPRVGAFGAVLIRAGQVLDSIVLYPAVAEQDFDIVSVEWPRGTRWPRTTILAHNRSATHALLVSLEPGTSPVPFSGYVRFPYPGHAAVRGPSRNALKVGFGLASSVDVPFLAVRPGSTFVSERTGALRVPVKYGTGLVLGSETLLGVLAGYRGPDLRSDAIEVHSVHPSGNQWVPVRSETFAVAPQGNLGTPVLSLSSNGLNLAWLEVAHDSRVAVRLRSSADSGHTWREVRGSSLEGSLAETDLVAALPGAILALHPWIAGRRPRQILLHRDGRGWASITDAPPSDGFRLRALVYPIDDTEIGIVDEIVVGADAQTYLRLEGRRISPECGEHNDSPAHS